jgi:cell division protein FtsL
MVMESDVRELLRRAGAETGKKSGSTVGVPAARKEKRYVFGDGARREAPKLPVAGPPPPRRVVRRRVSTFTIITVLFGFGITIVVYVNNIIQINRLAAEIGELQTKYESTLNANASLKAELNNKSAWDRIGTVAGGQLGLTFPTEQPAPLTLDPGLQKQFQRQ